LLQQLLADWLFSLSNWHWTGDLSASEMLP
jgi:hypothetical protein